MMEAREGRSLLAIDLEESPVEEEAKRRSLKRKKKKNLRRRRKKIVMMEAREGGEVKANQRPKEKKEANQFPNSPLNLEEKERKEVLQVRVKRRKRNQKVTLMKSLRTCWQRLKMPWALRMLVLLLKLDVKRRKRKENQR